MSRTASAHGLTSAPPADWRDSSACKNNPDAMFPNNIGHEIENAKTYCYQCPVIERCLQWALETGEEYGVWGGLSEQERRRIRRRHGTRLIGVDDYTGTPRQQTCRTPEQAWDEFTEPDGEHLLWTGPKVVHQPEGNLSPNRLAFRLDRSREPDGPVMRTCGVSGCVKPAHLEDNTERQRCGTRPGYERHRRDGELACAPCRRANTDADYRLRRTGTTRVAV